MGRECVVMSWRGGFPHFGVEISPGMVMHFRRRRDHRHRRLPLWFEGELVCCKVKGDWAKQQVTWRQVVNNRARVGRSLFYKAKSSLIFSNRELGGR